MRPIPFLIVLAIESGCAQTENSDSGESDEPAALGTLHESLAMPETATLNPEDFDGAHACGICHGEHLTEWETSSHAYAMKDPVFRALVDRRQKDLDSREDQFCTQCHSAIATRGGEVTPGFDFDDLSAIALEGVTCVACHQVTGLEREYNSGHRLDASAPMAGGISDPAPTAAHDSVESELIQSSAFCAGCHDVIETNGLELERPYEEWVESPLGNTDQTCQTCHMPEREGEAVKGGATRTLHSHRFRGVSIPLLDGFVPDDETVALLEQDVDDLLGESASISVAVPDSVKPGGQLDLVLTVENHIFGHNFPTGSNFMREFWLEVRATDGEGRVLYQTGHRDENGDLRNRWSELDPFGDPDLITLTSDLIDEGGNPVLFPWEAIELINRAIAPGHQRTYTLFVPIPEDTSEFVEVVASLRFREFAPYLLRALELDHYVPQLKVRTIDSKTAVISLDSQ